MTNVKQKKHDKTIHRENDVQLRRRREISNHESGVDSLHCYAEALKDELKPTNAAARSWRQSIGRDRWKNAAASSLSALSVSTATGTKQ